MAEPRACPNCEGNAFKVVAGGRLRCAACGRDLILRTPLGPLVLTWIVCAVAVSLVNFGLFAAGIRWDTPARWMIVGIVTAIFAVRVSDRFRKLRPA